ncbi:MAG: DUF2235 domain-containing protein [Pseudomonadota bacterium]
MANELVTNAVASNRDVPATAPGPCQDCSDVVHIAIFFDGTGNNKAEDEVDQKWSNVARMFFAAQARQSPNSYPIYIAGVGTPYNGNPVSTWYSKASVWLQDGALGMGVGTGGDRRMSQGDDTVNERLRAALIANAQALGGPVAAYAKASSSASFAEVNAALQKHRLIKMINISFFGFSRGAALARAFCNRVIADCTMEGSQRLYNGYPIRFNFLGLFDTVASFGVPGQNMRTPFSERDLLVSPNVERCVHFVAANEVRAAFPVDLIRKNGKLAGEWLEVTYPGVHSDVGGGYRSSDQGIDNNYARIPMRDMMREACASGVRILSYQEIKKTRFSFFQQRYECRAAVEADYLGYMAACGPVSGTIEAQMRKHRILFYGTCGTMYRKGIKTPGDRRRDEDAYKFLGAKGMAYEIELYRGTAALGKWLRFGGDTVTGFANYVKPEQWKIDAWDSTTSDVAVSFVSRYVHDSMVDFLGNMIDQSYFKARGVEESGDSIWQEGGHWISKEARKAQEATGEAVDATTAAAKKAAAATEKAARDAADAAQRRAHEAAQYAKKKADEAAAMGHAAYDATAKAANAAADAAAKRAHAAADYAAKKAHEASELAKKTYHSAERKVDQIEADAEHLIESGMTWIKRTVQEIKHVGH